MILGVCVLPKAPLEAWGRTAFGALVVAAVAAAWSPSATAEPAPPSSPPRLAGSEAPRAAALTPANLTGLAPVAVDVRLTEKGGGARLEFDLSRSVGVRAFALVDPDRIVVELPEVSFQIAHDPKRAAGKGPVKAFRFGHFAPGRSRVVIDLARPARIERAQTVALSPDGSAQGPARLVIELQPETREGFRAAARAVDESSAARGQDAPQVASVPSVAGKPIVVIDPGHGGVDPGTVGRAPGKDKDAPLEKDVVLEFARTLTARIEADGRYAVVMTRRSDVFVSLDERVRIARSVNAALFLSIHADSLQGAGSVVGATVYTVSDRASDAEAARVAEAENGADRAAGAEDAEQVGDVTDILFDLTRRESRAFAAVFSRSLVAYLGKSVKLHKNPSRSAGFRVLKAPDVPSALLELGYLSSEKDAELLTSPEWRERATKAVADAVFAFLAQPGASEATPVARTAEATSSRSAASPGRPAAP